MSDSSTTALIAHYMDDAEAPMFLSGFFKSPPRNFHNTEFVEIDIERDEEDVAVPVQDLSADSRKNERNTYTNRKQKPPVFSEEASIASFDLVKRAAGNDPFQDPDFAENAAEQAFSVARKLEKKIRRSIELMAAQVLQSSGTITLVDSAGATIFTEDFQPKTTHFPTAGNDWGGGSETPLADLASLARVIRRDGRKQPTDLIFGRTALIDFLAHSTVTARLDNRRMELGMVAPEMRGQGATYYGDVWIDTYRFRMWTYDAVYKHPQTGTLTPYVTDDNVIMLCESGRLDLTYGAVPRIVEPEGRAASFLPSRMSSTELGLDLSMSAWLTPNGKHLKIDVGTRPLTIPTAIDTFGCLNTRA